MFHLSTTVMPFSVRGVIGPSCRSREVPASGPARSLASEMMVGRATSVRAMDVKRNSPRRRHWCCNCVSPSESAAVVSMNDAAGQWARAPTVLLVGIDPGHEWLDSLEKGAGGY